MVKFSHRISRLALADLRFGRGRRTIFFLDFLFFFYFSLSGKQGCIPVGCVPSAAVAVSAATHAPSMHVPLCHAPPLPCMPPAMHALCHTCPHHACLPCHACPPCHAHPYHKCPPCHTRPPPMDRMTDASENITFPQLLLRTVDIALTLLHAGNSESANIWFKSYFSVTRECNLVFKYNRI